MNKKELVDLTLYYHTETKMAVRVSVTGHDAEAVWLPKSQIECYPVGETGKRQVEVTLPIWLAIDKGLENA